MTDERTKAVMQRMRENLVTQHDATNTGGRRRRRRPPSEGGREHQPGNIFACSSAGTRLEGDPSGGMSVRHESLVTFFNCTPKTISDGTSYPAMLIIADVIAAAALRGATPRGVRVGDPAGVLPGAQERVVVGLVHGDETIHLDAGRLKGTDRTNEGIAIGADDAFDVGVIGEDCRSCLLIGVAAPRGALLGNDLDVGRERLFEALLLERIVGLPGAPRMMAMSPPLGNDLPNCVPQAWPARTGRYRCRSGSRSRGCRSWRPTTETTFAP